MSTFSSYASPLDEPGIQKCTGTFEVARGMAEEVLGRALHQIRLKELDKFRIPCALQFSNEMFGHTIQGFGFQNDERVDDRILVEE